MAIVKTLRYPLQVPAVFEDPIPGSDYIYFQNDAYSKSTLNQVYDYGIVLSTSGVISTGNTFGSSRPTEGVGFGYGGMLILNGETTHVRHKQFNVNNDYQNNLDFAPFASMDPTRSALGSNYWSDGYNNMVMAIWNYHNANAASNVYYSQIAPYYWFKLNTNSRDLASSNFVTSGPSYFSPAWSGIAFGSTAFPIYRNPNTNSLVWVQMAYYGANNGSAYGYTPYAIGGASNYPIFSASHTDQRNTGNNNGNRTTQFIGPSYRDGYSMTLQNNTNNDYTQNILKYYDNAGNNTVTFPYSNTIVPFPSGLGWTGTYYVSTNSNLTIAQPGTPITAIVSATISGSVSGNVLTVSSITTGSVRIGQMISGSGVIVTSTITNAISIDANGIGTYNISQAGGNASPGTTINAILTCTLTGSILPGYYQANGGQYSQLIVSVMTSITPGGRLWPGMNLGAATITTPTFITAYTTATSGWNTTTNVGMDRITNPGATGGTFGGTTPKYSSRTFVDPVAPSVSRAWYTPYFDNTGKYQPFYYQWTTATDVFSRSANVTVNYATGTSLTNYWAPDQFSSNVTDVSYGHQHVWYNETFVSSTGTRFLMLMQFHGAGGVYDTTSTYRTFPIYSVDPTNPLTLYYVNNIVVPQTPKNLVWLNDARTLFAVICHSATYVYNYVNTATNFVLTATFPYQFNAVGRDNTNKVWALDTGPQGYGRVHLLSGVPSTVTVTPNTSTFSYAGSTSTVLFSVDAFDLTASRMTASINLSVIGTNLQILNTSGQYVSTMTVVTSTSSSTIVTGQIIGSGVSNISASVSI